MNKQQFISELESELIKNKAQGVEDILSDYEEHFIGAVQAGKTEEEIIKALGNPSEIAKNYAACTSVEDNIEAKEEKIVFASNTNIKDTNANAVEEMSRQINIQLDNIEKRSVEIKKNTPKVSGGLKSIIVLLSLIISCFMVIVGNALFSLKLKNPSRDLFYSVDYSRDGDVIIRIENNSSYDYENVTISVDYSSGKDGNTRNAMEFNKSLTNRSGGYVEIPIGGSFEGVEKVEIVIDHLPIYTREYEIYTEMEAYRRNNDLTAKYVAFTFIGIVCAGILAALIVEYNKQKREKTKGNA